MELLTVGEAFDDLILAGLPRLPRLGEELRVSTVTRSLGGGAIITAVAAARLGLTVACITAIGEDNAIACRREAVRLVNLRQSAERPAFTVALATARDRAFVTFDGVNRLLEPRLLARLRRQRLAPRHVHFALSPRRCRAWVPVVESMRARGRTTSWDFGWNERLLDDPSFDRLLGTVDWLFVNEHEARLYARASSLAAALKRWPEVARATVVKVGADGAVALTPAGNTRQPAPRVRVVETTGAGDAFNAGFLAALLRGSSITTALRLGNHVGASSTRVPGGIDALPRRADLPDWARRELVSARRS